MMMTTVTEHKFTKSGEHLTREIPPEELAALNGLVTTQSAAGAEHLPQPVLAPQPTGDGTMSPAQTRLAQLRAAYREKTGLSSDTRIVARQIMVGEKTETWHFLIFGWPDLSSVGAQIARDMERFAQKKFDVSRNIVLSIATAALLSHGVVCGEVDETPYFTADEAWEYSHDPATMELTARLFAVINELNPDALPKP